MRSTFFAFLFALIPCLFWPKVQAQAQWDFSPQTCTGQLREMDLLGCSEGWFPSHGTPQNKLQGTNEYGYAWHVPGLDGEGMYHPFNFVKDEYYNVTLRYRLWDPVSQNIGSGALNLFACDGLIPSTGGPQAPTPIQAIATFPPVGTTWVEEEFCFQASESFSQFYVTIVATSARLDLNIDDVHITVQIPQTTSETVTVCDNEDAILSPIWTWSWTGPGLESSSTNWVAELPGTYTGHHVDDNNCWVETKTVIVNHIPAPVISGMAYEACVPQPITITPVVTGSNPPYTYSWSNGLIGDGTGTVTIQHNTPGSYSYDLTVTSANGCTSTMTYPVEIHEPILVPNLDVTDPTCDIAILTFTNQQLGVNYQIDWGDGTPIEFSTTPSSFMHNYAPGTYTITVSASNACGSVQSTITTTAYEAPNVSITSSGSCDNGFNLSASVTSGTPGYTYDWSTGGIAAAEHVPGGLVPTTYSVTVTDANNCTAVASITLDPCPCLPAIVPMPVFKCEGDRMIVEFRNQQTDNTLMKVKEVVLMLYECAERGSAIDVTTHQQFPFIVGDPDVGLINGEVFYDITEWYNNLNTDGCVCVCGELVFKACDDKWYTSGGGSGPELSFAAIQHELNIPNYFNNPDDDDPDDPQGNPEGTRSMNGAAHEESGFAVCPCPEDGSVSDCDDVLDNIWPQLYHVISKGTDEDTWNEMVNEAPFIYPNPATTGFTIELTDDAESLIIYDVFGRAVSTHGRLNAGNHSISIEPLSQGYYLVVVEGANGELSCSKLMVE